MSHVSELEEENARGAISLARIFFSRLANLMRARSAARRREWRRPQFEALEARFLLSADLVGSVQLDAVAPLLPGDHERATVVVQNVGDAATKGRVSVQLYASADGVLDPSDTLLDTGKIAGRLAPGASKNAKLSFDVPDGLPPGSYSLLAVVDSSDKVHESNEANNVAVGPQFDIAWMFGGGPGHSRDSLLVHDADGTRVLFSLSGPGTGEITMDGGQWDVSLTGTNSSSVLTVLTLGGGDGRVALDDIHASGALGALLAPTMDLTGTLAIGGPLTAGLLLGSATGAVIAAPTITGTSFLGLSVKGIAILGDVEDSQILIGANLGADGQLGGSGANADSYSAGNLGDLLIGGSMSSSQVRVGQDPVDGVFDNGNDVLLGGTIRSITILGSMSGDSEFVASAFPAFAWIDGRAVDTAVDPRFIDHLGGHAAPVAVADSFSVNEDNTLTVAAPGVLGNDTDVDSSSLTALLGSGPTNGTLTFNSDGSFSYTPNANFNGADSFTYKANDGAADSNLATVSLTVNAVNDAPVLGAIPDKITLINQQLSVQASATDVDTPPSGLTYSLVGTVPTGAAITAAGLFTWTPTAFGTTSITVRVTDDGSLTDQKTFSVNVVAPPLMAIDDVMVVEGDSGTTDAVFRVLLSGPAPEQGVSVNYANSGVFGATPGSDFTAVSGTLTFAPGETEKTFAVPIIGNTTIEGDEMFQYVLSSPVNAALSTKSAAFGEIMDNDDGATHVGIDRRTVFEGNSGTTDAVFNVLLSNPSTSTVTVDYATANGTAGAGDFTPTSGTLTFAPGVTQQAIHVAIVADTTAEGDEAFSVRLTNASANATITFNPGNSAANGVIVNDDGPGLMLASSVASNPISGSTLDAAQLQATLTAAITLWTQALGANDPRLAALDSITIDTAAFSGAELGGSFGSAIYIDTDAAGHGWFVDLTPAASSEFARHLGGGALAATPSSEAFGRMDLLTVVMHEVGHVLGLQHDDAARYAVMQEQLDPGTRYTLAAPKFDFEALDARGPGATIAWDEASLDWHLHRGSYAAPFERAGSGKVPEFLRI